MLMIEPGNETLIDGRTDGLTDGRTDGQTDAQTQIICGGYNIIPLTISSGGVLKKKQHAVNNSKFLKLFHRFPRFSILSCLYQLLAHAKGLFKIMFGQQLNFFLYFRKG